MAEHEACIDQVLTSYVQSEIAFELKLQALSVKRAALGESRDDSEAADVSSDYKKAQKRNKILLKELEIHAAKLRSRTCFCPIDSQLDKLKRKYYQHLEKNTATKTDSR